MTEDIAVEMFKTFLKLIEDGTYFKGVQQPEYKIKAQQKFLLMVSKKLLEVIPPIYRRKTQPLIDSLISCST